jgi:TolB protein
MAVHRASDEIERWVTNTRGIATTRIAYVRGQAIRIVDSDGAAEITVPTEDCGVSPAWSPSGTMLAYATCGVDSRIHVIDLATGRARTVIGPTRNAIYITPSFSPDGASIVYARRNEDQADLFLLSLSQGATAARLTATRGVENTNPVFSPDGRRITYVSGLQGHPELYIMDADGTGADVLTNYDFSEKNYRSDPDWSPDGRLVVYQERINDRFQIRTIRVSGSTPKPLTSEGENEQPSWSPDSRHLVITSTRTGVRQLWIMDTESGRMRQLTKSAGSKLASWSARIAGP